MILPLVIGLAMLIEGSDDGRGGPREGCPGFTVHVERLTDVSADRADPSSARRNVTFEGTVSMEGEHPVDVDGISVPLATAPDAEVHVELSDDTRLEPGETARFSGSGFVELTGTPAVIPDDAAARVDWELQDVTDAAGC